MGGQAGSQPIGPTLTARRTKPLRARRFCCPMLRSARSSSICGRWRSRRNGTRPPSDAGAEKTLI